MHPFCTDRPAASDVVSALRDKVRAIDNRRAVMLLLAAFASLACFAAGSSGSECVSSAAKCRSAEPMRYLWTPGARPEPVTHGERVWSQDPVERGS
ncbi:hypothetical protein BH18ACI5_BH18ACI5_22830 [soil metagenome]